MLQNWLYYMHKKIQVFFPLYNNFFPHEYTRAFIREKVKFHEMKNKQKTAFAFFCIKYS